MKTQITSNERLQIIGLLTLAERHNARLQDVRKTIIELLGGKEGDPYDWTGHIDDAMFEDSRRDADQLLQRLHIQVSDQPVAGEAVPSDAIGPGAGAGDRDAFSR
jgi:hypothetical protein